MKILGIEFAPMTAEDHQGFEGADPGSFIAEVGETILIYSPGSETLTEIANGELEEREWKINRSR